MENKIHIVYGPTASGKTSYSLELAQKSDSVIINGDAMQIYREIPIITNQPTAEERGVIPHELFGLKSIVENSDMNKWLDMVLPLIKRVMAENKIPIIVGGTGMYLKALIKGISTIPEVPVEIKNEIRKRFKDVGINEFYNLLKVKDPLSAEKIKPGDSQRMMRALEVMEYTGVSIKQWNTQPHKTFFDEKDFEIHFLDRPREEIYKNIDERFENFIELGALEEAEKANEIFKGSGLSELEIESLPAYKAHGLRELISYIKGEISLETAIKHSQQVTRNYAKRQLTWWRGQMNY